MPRTHPPGADRRYEYVPFSELSARDQNRVLSGYPHKSAHLGDEDYLYPVKRDGSLAHARRWMSNDVATRAWNEYAAGAMVIADALQELGYDAHVQPGVAMRAALGGPGRVMDYPHVIVERRDKKKVELLADFEVFPEDVVIHAGSSDFVADLLKRTRLDSKFAVVRHPLAR
jgi:hypothetical protein